MLALMEGRLNDAEELIAQTAEIGSRAQSWNALVTQRLALFVLRRAQGRLDELEDAITRSVHEYPSLLRFQCAVAHLYAELGREHEGRRAFDAVLAHDLAQEYLDAEWLFALSLLPGPCAFLSDQGAAETLYSLLQPHERHYAQAPVEAIFGSLARGLGELAAVLGRHDDAERHFEVAIEVERRMGGRPWLAHAQHDLAKTLLVRAAPGDEERARAVLEEAVSTYRELGMASWAARAAALA
jgi:tetratricopeptide (TPR) repeat protein